LQLVSLHPLRRQYFHHKQHLLTPHTRFGGQAVSLAINYTYSAQFRAAGYVPFVVEGVEYGETRQYGNFSFTRIYEAGHEIPYYQPLASLAFFNRQNLGYNIADGTMMVTANYSTVGQANATHTEPFVPLPSSTTMMPSQTYHSNLTETGGPRW